MSNQTEQTPGWGPPPTPQPPKPKRQFTVTKIAIGVAAGITLFLVGSGILLAMLISSGSDGAKQAVATTAAADFTPPAQAPAADTPDEPATTAAAPADEMAIGETGSFTSDAGDAADITITKIQATTRDPAPYGERASHGWYVVFHLKATGQSGGYDLNSFDFYATSSNGYHAEDPEYLDSWGTAFEGGTLHAGEHMSGTIVYDLPTKHGKLVYSPNLDGEPLATWSY